MSKHAFKIFWLAYFVVLALAANHAFGHGSFTHAEIEWMERQYSVDGNSKCCNEHDVHIGQNVQWRINGRGYEVQINGNWHAIPPNLLMASKPDDPSPFGVEALLFYSVYPSGIRIWCFRPEPLM